MRYIVVLMLLFGLMGCGSGGESPVVDGKAISGKEFDAYLAYKRITPTDDRQRQALLKKYVEPVGWAEPSEAQQLPNNRWRLPIELPIPSI